jgi:glycolate oxidase iron-sulfur subunit
MQTELPAELLATDAGRRADEILRACVHCGFCNATCPTYQLVGDELDGPRGRIYLIKEMLESSTVNPVAVRHLDRCLTCRACETTCPSGVAYGELAEIGREFMESAAQRGPLAVLQRRWLKAVVPEPGRFRWWARLGLWFRWMLPRRLASQVPSLGRRRGEAQQSPSSAAFRRRVVVMEGCVQQVSTPDVNEALADLLAKRGIEVLRIPEEACCGSLALHLGDREGAEAVMRRNLDALTPYLDQVEAVISTASGCGVTLKDYHRLLFADPDYADRARALSDKTLDISQYLAAQDASWERARDLRRVAWHAPCSLQHGQQLRGLVEALLRGAGYELVPVRDSHLCCGSAGTYSLLQPELAEQLKANKLAALMAAEPEVIATANVGCQLHMRTEASVPVVHWLELLR